MIDSHLKIPTMQWKKIYLFRKDFCRKRQRQRRGLSRSALLSVSNLLRLSPLFVLEGGRNLQKGKRVREVFSRADLSSLFAWKQCKSNPSLRLKYAWSCVGTNKWQLNTSCFNHYLFSFFSFLFFYYWFYLFIVLSSVLSSLSFRKNIEVSVFLSLCFLL